MRRSSAGLRNNEPGRNTSGSAREVVAQQRVVGRHGVEQRVVVAARSAQAGALLVGDLGVKRFVNRARGAAVSFARCSTRAVPAGGRPALDLAERQLGLELAAEPRADVGDAQRGVSEQALVDRGRICSTSSAR